MGSSHGSSGDGVGSRLAADPSRLDIYTRSEDIKDSAKVGELSAVISVVGSADGDGVLGGGGGVVGGVGVVVSCCDDDGDAGGNGGFDSGVEGFGLGAAEGHGEDGVLLGVLADEVDAADDAGVGAGSLAVEDLDGD